MAFFFSCGSAGIGIFTRAGVKCGSRTIVRVLVEDIGSGDEGFRFVGLFHRLIFA
jgi:hypothetical protein